MMDTLTIILGSTIMRKKIILRGSMALLVVVVLILLCSPGCVSQEELQLSQKQNRELSERVTRLEKQLEYYKNSTQVYAQRTAELENQLQQARQRLRISTTQSQQTSGPVSTTSTEAGAGPSTYEVAQGDSLWKIAEEQLGNGLRYKDILALNPSIKKENRLTVGARLNLPSK